MVNGTSGSSKCTDAHATNAPAPTGAAMTAMPRRSFSEDVQPDQPDPAASNAGMANRTPVGRIRPAAAARPAAIHQLRRRRARKAAIEAARNGPSAYPQTSTKAAGKQANNHTDRSANCRSAVSASTKRYNATPARRDPRFATTTMAVVGPPGRSASARRPRRMNPGKNLTPSSGRAS